MERAGSVTSTIARLRTVPPLAEFLTKNSLSLKIIASPWGEILVKAMVTR